jgi:hypothetical protein
MISSYIPYGTGDEVKKARYQYTQWKAILSKDVIFKVYDVRFISTRTVGYVYPIIFFNSCKAWYHVGDLQKSFADYLYREGDNND